MGGNSMTKRAKQKNAKLDLLIKSSTNSMSIRELTRLTQ